MKIHIDTIWLEPVEQQVPEGLREAASRTPWLTRGLIRQGISTPEQARAFLDPHFYQPSDPLDLPDIGKAVDRLKRAIRGKEIIGVWGDFDVDGQTSTALLVSALRALGAEVRYHIPVRAREGHGIGLPALEQFLNQGVQLLLTCDTGISAHAAVAHARQRGVDCIITDHHVLPDALPPAHAVVNPQRLPDGHPARTLSGVGAAYKLVELLRAEFHQEELAKQHLDLVALGLVADVAGLTGDARYLTQLGLNQLRRPHRPGLIKLYELAELEPAHLTEQHIGFTIAPRLNAIGRLDDANPVVEFLTSEDTQVIAVTAARLEGLNGERRFLTEQVLMGALSQIERNPALLDEPVLLLSHSDWPGGVVGIVANRLAELFQRPAVLLTGSPGGRLQGSARSIEGVNIAEAIAAGKEFLHGFGGHAMAAGLSLESGNLPAFQRRLAEAVRGQIGDRPLIKQIQIDAFLELDQIQLDLIAEIDQLAPFGAGNPPLVFATRNLHAVDSNPVGKTGEHLQVLVEDERGQTRRLIWWQADQELLPAGRFDLAYTLRASNYRGQPEIQMEWLHARPIPEAVPEITARKYEAIFDHRSADEPLALLRQYLSEKAVLWQEGKPLPPEARTRSELEPGETLIIWNPPPGRMELLQALKSSRPKRVVLFAVPGGSDSPADFLKNLTGMVRYALRARGGQVALFRLAEALNQRISVVEAGIRWLSARGFITIQAESQEGWRLAQGGVPDPERVKLMETALRSILQETAAFRSFYTRAEPEEILEYD